MKQDLAWRSVGCSAGALGLPWLWAQAFDDGLFTARHGDLDVAPRAEPGAASPLPLDGRPRRARRAPVGRAGQVRRRSSLPRRGAAGQGAARRRTSSTGRATRGRGRRRLATATRPARGVGRRRRSWPPPGVDRRTYRARRRRQRARAGPVAEAGRSRSPRRRRTPATTRWSTPRLSATPLGTSPARRSRRARSARPAPSPASSPSLRRRPGAERQRGRAARLDAAEPRLPARAQGPRHGARREADAAQSRGVRGICGASPGGPSAAYSVRSDALSALIPAAIASWSGSRPATASFYKPYPGSLGRRPRGGRRRRP